MLSPEDDAGISGDSSEQFYSFEDEPEADEPVSERFFMRNILWECHRFFNVEIVYYIVQVRLLQFHKRQKMTFLNIFIWLCKMKMPARGMFPFFGGT